MNFTGKQIHNFRRGCYIVVSLLIFHEFAYFIHFNTSYHGHDVFYRYNNESSEAERSFVDGLPLINIPTEIGSNSRSVSRNSKEEADDDDDDDDGKLHVVISHCKLSIGWIWKSYLYNQSYESVTIISKCGVPIPPEDMPPSITLTHPHQQDQNQHQEQNDNKTLVQIISLPNVGRCDHSFAYWIAMVLGNEEKSMKDDYQLLYSNRDQNTSNNSINKINNSSSSSSSSSSNNIINPFQSITIDPKDYIIFMKDNDNRYRSFEEPIPLQNMFVEIKTNNVGMACASVLHNMEKYTDSMTSWAHRGVMWNRVQMKEYRADKYKNDIIVEFQSSHRPMGGTLCFGNFTILHLFFVLVLVLVFFLF